MCDKCTPAFKKRFVFTFYRQLDVSDPSPILACIHSIFSGQRFFSDVYWGMASACNAQRCCLKAYESTCLELRRGDEFLGCGETFNFFRHRDGRFVVESCRLEMLLKSTLGDFLGLKASFAASATRLKIRAPPIKSGAPTNCPLDSSWQVDSEWFHKMFVNS